MSSVIDPQPEPSPNDELVAYLDGELPPDECRRVEDRLAADDGYRQQLRDLDQAWEALSALPSTAVDDSFARTTIELACVAAEEDLSQRTAEATAENRGRKRWWIGAGVAAAVIGFVMMRALAVHRNNMILTDLPVIQQSSTLAFTDNVDFLRQLAKAVPTDEFINDTPAFNRNLADFEKANSESLSERKDWVDSLSADQKATLEDRARAFDDMRQTPAEKSRLRNLMNEVRHEPELQKTLAAYGQWLGRRTAGEQDTLRDEFTGMTTTEQVAEVEKLVRETNEQAARHLKPADEVVLRSAILELAKAKKEELQKLPGGRGEWVAKLDVSRPGAAMSLLGFMAFNRENGEANIESLVNKLSPEAQEHWKKLGRGRRERWMQMWQWAYDALKPEAGPAKLEKFFLSEDLSRDERQRLLGLPRNDMKNELERLYLGSEAGIDNRLPFWREFNGGRGPRNGPGPGPGPGPEGGPFGRRPEGPPPEDGFGPGPPPDGPFDRPPGPDGRRGRPPGGPDDRRFDDGRPGDRPQRPRPPGQQPPPPPPDDRNR